MTMFETQKERLYGVGKFVTLTNHKNIVCGIVIGHELKANDYYYNIKAIRTTDKGYDVANLIGVPEWNIMASNYNFDDICLRCPNRQIEYPDCGGFCDFEPNNYEDDEDNEYENELNNHDHQGLDYVNGHLNAYEDNESSKKLDSIYDLRDLKSYLKSQKTTLKAKDFIRNMKQFRLSTKRNDEFYITSDIRIMERNGVRWWGEINTYKDLKLSYIYKQRLSLHRGEEHIPFDVISEHTINDNETEYWLDGPIERLKVIKDFGSRTTKHLFRD